METKTFFPSATHDEALARLDFLVTDRRRLGLLLGPAGSGKSLVLEMSARAWRKANHAVALVNATGCTPHDLLAEIAAHWRCAQGPQAPAFVLWRAIADELQVHRCEQRASILLVDDAGQSPAPTLETIERLMHLGDVLQPRLTIVLATQPEHLSHLGRGLLQRVELRSDLAPLDVAETRDYLVHHFAGRVDAPELDIQATERLHALAAGIPRRIDQLAKLALIAAEGSGRDMLDGEMLEQVCRELALPQDLC